MFELVLAGYTAIWTIVALAMFGIAVTIMTSAVTYLVEVELNGITHWMDYAKPIGYILVCILFLMQSFTSINASLSYVAVLMGGWL